MKQGKNFNSLEPMSIEVGTMVTKGFQYIVVRKNEKFNINITKVVHGVATLALGSRPKQGRARVLSQP